MNSSDFVIENKFINNNNNNKKRKVGKIIPIVLLLVLVGILAFLVYKVKFDKKSTDKKSENYEEYDPNYPLESEGSVKQEQTTTVTSNINSNIATTSNAVNGNTSVTGVRLNESNITMTVGQTKVITATVLPTNAANKGVVFSSSNTSVATIDNNGKITTKAVGVTNITVKTKENGKSATTKLTVVAKPISVTGIKLNASTLKIYKGGKAKLTATVSPSNATNKNVSWSSSNSKVATVDSNGNVTGVSVGTAVISATTKDGNKRATCTITVSEQSISPTSITITGSSKNVYIGRTLQLNIKYNPTNANTNTKITWASSNTKVAKVNSNGLVTGVGIGNATITATTQNNKKYSYNVSSSPSRNAADYSVKIVVKSTTGNKYGVTYTYSYVIISSTNPSLAGINPSKIKYGADEFELTGKNDSRPITQFCDSSKKATIYLNANNEPISGVSVKCN